MTLTSREVVFMILQFLDEMNFKECARKLEKESGFFFNLSFFEDAVMNSKWDDTEDYLSGFTKVDDNQNSMKLFLGLRGLKYCEAMNSSDHRKALDILEKDLAVFSTSHQELFNELKMLFNLNNPSECELQLSYGDMKSAVLVELKNLIQTNPLLRDKIHFPGLQNSHLWTLINQRQSLQCQHQFYNNPRPIPLRSTQPHRAYPPSPFMVPTGSSS